MVWKNGPHNCRMGTVGSDKGYDMEVADDFEASWR